MCSPAATPSRFESACPHAPLRLCKHSDHVQQQARRAALLTYSDAWAPHPHWRAPQRGPLSAAPSCAVALAPEGRLRLAALTILPCTLAALPERSPQTSHLPCMRGCDLQGMHVASRGINLQALNRARIMRGRTMQGSLPRRALAPTQLLQVSLSTAAHCSPAAAVGATWRAIRHSFRPGWGFDQPIYSDNTICG